MHSKWFIWLTTELLAPSLALVTLLPVDVAPFPGLQNTRNIRRGFMKIRHPHACTHPYIVTASQTLHDLLPADGSAAASSDCGSSHRVSRVSLCLQHEILTFSPHMNK